MAHVESGAPRGYRNPEKSDLLVLEAPDIPQPRFLTRSNWEMFGFRSLGSNHKPVQESEMIVMRLVQIQSQT